MINKLSAPLYPLSNNLSKNKLDSVNNESVGKVANGKDDNEAKKAATDFEALLLQQMINSMWQAVPKDKLLGSNEEEIYRGMHTEALSKSLSEGNGFGIKEVIYNEIVGKR